APVQHAVINGDDITGATVFVVEEDMDTGPVLSTLSEPVQPAQTAGELLDRLAQAGADLLLSTLDGLAAGALTPVPQPADGVSYAPKISTADARVRWSHPAQSVDRRIRGCTPAPGAWTGWHDERLKIGPVSLEPAAPALSSGPAPAPDEALAPGELSVTKAGVLVGTATTAVRLGQVQPAGKKPMPATDWARGARGDRFADGTGLGTQAGP
ncbi:MAG: methionyl-tRNA formyltransferase, partial [Micrococcales bacterium]